MATPYAIPQVLWESLDAVLFTKGMAFAREIAAELKVNAAPLLQALNTQERSKFVILPEDELSLHQCCAAIPNGKFWIRCRSPVLACGSRYCTTHDKTAPIVPSHLEEAQRVDVKGDVYFKKDDDSVVNRDGRVVGILKGSKLTLFEIET